MIVHETVREVYDHAEADALVRGFRAYRRDYPKDSYDILGQVGVELFRGASFFVLENEDAALSFAAIHIGKRKKNMWEPYCNWTLAYTTPSHRRLGFARSLAKKMLHHCAFLGCKRIKSKAGSYLGLRLHWSLGHHVWGFCDTGEIQIDSPLAGVFPQASTPMGARAVTRAITPMTGAELREGILARRWQPDNDYDFLCAPSSASMVTPASA